MKHIQTLNTRDMADEMESSALAGLASLLGHRAMTCCMVIANRYAKEMNTEYKNSIDTLIAKVLDRI